VGVFLIMIELRDLVTILVHPINIQLLNAIEPWMESDLALFVITLVIVGLIEFLRFKQIEDKIKNAEILEKEIVEWVKTCEGLRDHLTTVVEDWETQKRTGRIGTVTNYGMSRFNERKMLYDKADLKIKEYNDKRSKR
jgi:hypothetical protein